MSHIHHLEDIFNHGSDLVQNLSNIQRALSNPSSITLKADGAPAFFFGTDPSDGKFFISTKSFLGKNPVLLKCEDDIRNTSYPDDVKRKLYVLYTTLIDTYDCVYQADYLYDWTTLNKSHINGVDYVIFHPNTICYAVPFDSDLGKQICHSFVGIAVHGKFTMEDSKWIRESISKAPLKKPNVWQMDLNVPAENISGLFSIDESVMDELQNFFLVEHNIKLLSRYVNNRVKLNSFINKHSVSDFIEFGIDHLDAKMRARKSQKGKEYLHQRLVEFDHGACDCSDEISELFDLIKSISKHKVKIINLLNKSSEIETFLLTKDGYECTLHEGFVLSSDFGTYKLVDRLKFSKANFSDDYIKGWSKP